MSDVSGDWPDFIKQHFTEDVPFLKFMEMTVDATGPGRAAVSLPLKPEYANSYGISHGGIAALLVDTAAGVALRGLKLTIVTVEMSVSYFAPLPLEGRVRAEATLVHRGRRILHAEIAVLAPDGTLAAMGRAIYAVTGEDTGNYRKS